MKREGYIKFFSFALVAALALGTGTCLIHGPGQARETIAAPRAAGETLVIDAGHGGEDGGAVSLTGVPESGINLSVALRLDGLLGLYGVDTRLLRTTDTSLHNSEAVTLREKKVSDLHNRVDIIERTENATLISIHQNTFPSAKYHGAQVFYANSSLSLPLATRTQETLRAVLDPANTRTPAKIPDTVYLMKHITCRAILVECGFLSNAEEEQKLLTPTYQTKLAAALAGAYLQFQDDAMTKGDAPNEG